MQSTSKFAMTADNDRLYEGLRIPPSLDNTTSVNFVLTQEPGKLKPKDLKIAIERNRAEREQRAEEQKKIREEGGGAGILDLRGILAEEKLNSVEGDPFKRQLREMAFLADVDDVEKQEIEKEFRISEEFLGSHMLSTEDVMIVYKQRARAQLQKKRTDWRIVQARQHTGHYAPSHGSVKAGTSAEIASSALARLRPQYDANRNDIWAKRMNSLRLFVSLVSKYIIRQRVSRRMAKVSGLFRSHDALTREEVLAFIARENETNKKQGAATAATSAAAGKSDKSVQFEGDAATAAAEKPHTADSGRPVSVAAMVFARDNEVLANRLRNEAVIAAAAAASHSGSASAEITSDMARRILFPQCLPASGGQGGRRAIPDPAGVESPIAFDDRTFFSLKVRPEHLTLRYAPHPVPTVPLYFPPCSEKALRTGAQEESALRPPADEGIATAADLDRWLAASNPSPEPASFTALLQTGARKRTTLAGDETSSPSVPSFLSGSNDAVSWSRQDVDFLRPRPEHRVFVPPPRRCELDADWLLRPDAEPLVYAPDPSIRTSWASRAGFLSANIYLLGSQESRNRDPPPPPGPTLSDYYLPDTDRHLSGLHCYSHDHLRGTLQPDPDIPPLQTRQDRADYLTDSESDSEDAYGHAPPTMARAKQILRPPPAPKKEEAPDPKAKGAAKKVAAKAPAKEGPKAPVAAPSTVESDQPPQQQEDESGEFFGAGAARHEKREEQVELLRDRKTLDLESTWVRARRSHLDAVTKRLVDVSRQSACLAQALSVQLPFHQYEDQVYALTAQRTPDLPTSFVEVPTATAGGTLTLDSPAKSSSSPQRSGAL